MYDCTKKPPYKEDLPNTFKNKKDLSFPINVARNVARESVQTHFVFASDIELYPPNNFIQKFLNMVDVKINVFLNSAPKVITFNVSNIICLCQNFSSLLFFFAFCFLYFRLSYTHRVSIFFGHSDSG